MEVRRVWLLVVLPAVGGVVGLFGYTLWTVGESRRVGLPSAIGAAVGLLVALALTVRRSPR